MNQAEKERLAKVGKTFNAKKYIENEIKAIREQVGDRKVLLALSGGVDSSVCAALLYKAIGRQLVCVFVDHGCMRLNEGKMIKKVFKGQFGVNLIALDCEKRFLDKAKGVTDPETKRKIIGGEFIKVFADTARDLQKKYGNIDFLGQGTIYPDIIESGVGGHKAVKAHHNVGGLPKDILFKGLVEPVKYLYKDEVRKVGKLLGLPEEMVMRQPFPGPGLAVRCIGELTKEKLDILRQADFIFRDEMHTHVRLRDRHPRDLDAAVRQGRHRGASVQVRHHGRGEDRDEGEGREPRRVGRHPEAARDDRVGVIPRLRKGLAGARPTHFFLFGTRVVFLV